MGLPGSSLSSVLITGNTKATSLNCLPELFIAKAVGQKGSQQGGAFDEQGECFGDDGCEHFVFKCHLRTNGLATAWNIRVEPC